MAFWLGTGSFLSVIGMHRTNPKTQGSTLIRPYHGRLAKLG